MFTRILTVVALVSGIALCAGARDLNEAETQAFLEKIGAARKGQPFTSVDFHEEKTTKLLREPLVKEGTLAIKLPNQFRREDHSPDHTLYVSDGTDLWIYYPVFKEAEHYKLGQQRKLDESLTALTAGFDLAQLKANYKVSVAEEEPGWRLTLVPIKFGLRKSIPQILIWLNHDFDIAKSEVTIKDGKVISSFHNHRRSAIPESAFKFSPPEGTETLNPLEHRQGRD